MKKHSYFLAILSVITLLGWLNRTKTMAFFGDKQSPQAQTNVIVNAANAFLNSLDTGQRRIAQLEFLRPDVASATQFNMGNMRGGQNGHPPMNGDTTNRRGGGGRPPLNGDTANRRPGSSPGGRRPASGEQYGKAVWSNFPVSITPRSGIELAVLNQKQRTAAMRLLQVSLSAEGYKKVQEIMGSDQALADKGTDFVAGADHYLFAVLGSPDEKKTWMIEFGGHHLGLNVIISGAQGALTPTLTGAQPAVYTSNGKTIRTLAQENDKAFDLLGSLTDEQRKKVILNYRVGDLVLGPGHDGETIVAEGLKGSEMTVQQREKFLGLIKEWAGIINTAYQPVRLKDLQAGLSETYFCWSGAQTHENGRNGTAYYRIQGPKVLIEFSPQGNDGDLDNHVHTIYRDPTNEYGSSYKKQ